MIRYGHDIYLMRVSETIHQSRHNQSPPFEMIQILT